MIAWHTVIPCEELHDQGSAIFLEYTALATHPNGKIGCNAEPLKRCVGPPHCSKEGRIAQLELGASLSGREEAAKIREGDEARSKRQNAHTY